MADWTAFNENLRQGAQALAARAQAKQMREMALQDAIAKATAEAQIKAQYDPELTMFNKIFGEGQVGGFGKFNVPPGTTLKMGGLTMPLNPIYTEGEAKTASGAEQVISEISDLKNIIQSEPKEPGAAFPFFGKSAQAQGVKIPGFAPYGVTEKGQRYRTLRESINNRLLYLRSGAQINDKEYQRLSGMLPMVFRSDKVDVEQLDRFSSEFEKILGRIKSGAAADTRKTTTPNNDPLGLR